MIQRNDILFWGVGLALAVIGLYGVLSGFSFMFWLTQPASPETLVYLGGKAGCQPIDGYFADGKARSKCWDGVEQTEEEFLAEMLVRYEGPLEQMKSRSCTFHYYSPFVRISSSLVCGDVSFSEKEWPKVVKPWAVSKATLKKAGCDVYQYNSYLQPQTLLCPAKEGSAPAGAGGPAMELVPLAEFLLEQ